MICEMCGEEIDERVCPFCMTEQSSPEQANSIKRPVIKSINIKEDMPTAETALNRLQNEIDLARQSGVKALKVVHGYGSTGKGGIIKKEVHRYIQSSDKIKGWIPGEQFSADYTDTYYLLRQYPFLENDKDFRRRNRGITVIIF